MATRARKNILANFVWEGISIGPETGQCLRIEATREDLDLVAGWLLGTGFSYPVQEDQYETDRPLNNLNQKLLNALRYVGLQLLHDSPDCEEFDMPYPILRQNPENECQMQQSVDGGTSWTTVFDSSVCQPEIPAAPVIPPVIQFRQNRTRPEWLEESFDAGLTWRIAYDYSKYKARNLTHIENAISQIETNNYITENNNLWDSSSHDVNVFAPELVFDSTDKDADRNKAICYAVRVFVKTIMETAFQAAATTSPGEGLLGLVFEGVSTGIGAFLGGPFGAAVGAFFSTSLLAVADQGTNVHRRETYGQYEDEMVCCMYTTLKDDIPTQAAFEASFSGAFCDLNPDAQAFVDALITPLLSSDTNFLAFLRLAAEGVALGEFLPDCPCDDPGECTEFVLDTDTIGLLGLYSGRDVVAGQTIDISATGTWNNSEQDIGPNGTPPHIIAGYIAENIVIYKLIAQIEGEGDRVWHEIGQDGSFVAPIAGRLMVTVNEYHHPASVSDNTGSLNLSICISAPGECTDFTAGTGGWTTTDNPTDLGNGSVHYPGKGWGNEVLREGHTYSDGSGVFVRAPDSMADIEVRRVRITFDRAWLGTGVEAADLEKFFVIIADGTGTNGIAFPAGYPQPLMWTEDELEYEFVAPTSFWVQPIVQVVAGGYTWPVDQYVSQICLLTTTED